MFLGDDCRNRAIVVSWLGFFKGDSKISLVQKLSK